MTPAFRAAENAGSRRREAAAAAGADEVTWLHEVDQRTVDLTRVPAAFTDEATVWLGQRTGPGTDGATAYTCDLELRVSPEGRALFRKSAIVTMGPARRLGEGWVVPIEWRAATLAPLFPVFVGSLRIEAHSIALGGYYAPPFGVIGLVLDRAVLSIAARATARWFLTKVAASVG